MDPQMHTTEHILNQTMGRLFDCGRCFNAHIEKKKSKCDYRFDRSLTEAEIRDAESRVNDIIQQGMPVTEEWIPLAEAKAKAKAKGKYNLEKLPADVDKKIRIVKIGDYDACPCIGQHVGTTDEIGRFRITTTTFDSGVLRIRFKLDRNNPNPAKPEPN